MTSQRPSLYVGRRGMVVGWHAPLGPAVAIFESWSREVPRFSRALGRAGADLPVTPALWVAGDALVVAWCEEDGAWTTAIGLEDGAATDPVLAAPGARAIALGSGGDGATLFAADPEGIVSVALDASGRPGEAVRALSERRGGVIASAARIRDEGVLLFAHRGAAGWGVVAAAADGPVAVKHAEGRYASLHVEAVGSRAACVLGRTDGAVQIGLLGPGAKTIERPHALFDSSAPRLSTPQVVWMDDDWAVLAHEVEADRLRVQPLSKRLEPFTLPRCTGPFAAAYYARHLYALEIDPAPDGGDMWLWRCRRDGASPQQRRAALALDDRRPRRVRIEARGTLASLRDRLRRTGGYREAGDRCEVSADGATLRLHDDRGRLRIGFAPTDEVIGVHVVSALGDDPRLPETPSSLVRLARWVRLRMSAAARAAEEGERRWAEALAAGIGGALRDVQRAGSTLLLELTLSELPSADALDAWLRRLRDEQASRLGGET